MSGLPGEEDEALAERAISPPDSSPGRRLVARSAEETDQALVLEAAGS